jgi:cytochrome P450
MSSRISSYASLRADLLANPVQLALYLAGLGLFYFAASRVYDVYFGPLSKFPGPKLWAATYIPRLIAQAAGEESPTHGKLHERYGPVVRVGPNELSFANGQQAWKDIYGHRKGGQTQPSKDKTFYFQPAEPVPSILGANDADHTRVRRILAPAFSERAAKEQEPLLQRWMEFMHMKLGLHANGSDKIDMMKIFVCTSFDVMGESMHSVTLLLAQADHVGYR